MTMHTQLQQCIQQCNQTANQLRSMANQAQDSSVRNMLTEGAHYIELCIEDCQLSSQMVEQTQQWQQQPQVQYQY